MGKKKNRKDGECDEDLLNSLEDANMIMKEKIEECKKEIEPSLISMVFELFASLYFDEKESSRYWEHVLEHRTKMRGRLKRDVGIRVAILDYFSNIENRLKNPKIVEMELFEEILKASKEDPKTGLYNGKYFLEVLKNEINKAKRNNFSVSLLFVDIDDFKMYNDKFGHTAGDRILYHVSSIIQELFRGEDIAARFGGDEFVIMLPYAEKEDAVAVANRVADRARDISSGIEGSDDKEFPATLSIGVASFPQDADNADDLVKKADIALYKAKENGKNRIVEYSEKDKDVKVPNNRRVIDRFDCQGQEIFFKTRNSADKYRGYLRNISEKGLLIEIPFVIPLLYGAPLSVELKGGKKDSIELKGEILHARKRRTGCLAALRFDDSKCNTDEIKDFIEYFKK